MDRQKAIEQLNRVRFSNSLGFDDDLCWWFSCAGAELGERSVGLPEPRGGTCSPTLDSHTEGTLASVRRDRACRIAWVAISDNARAVLVRRYRLDLPTEHGWEGELGALSWVAIGLTTDAADRADLMQAVHGHKATAWLERARRASLAAHAEWGPAIRAAHRAVREQHVALIRAISAGAPVL